MFTRVYIHIYIAKIKSMYTRVYIYIYKYIYININVVFLRFYVLYLVRVTYYPYIAHVRSSVYIRLKRVHAETAHVKCLEP